MPLLKINQIHHISASVRLDESTAAQVDQYAAFIHASADDVVDKALNYVFSKDRDFQDFLKRPQAKQFASHCVFAKARARMQRSSLQRSLCRGVCDFCAGGEGVILHSISCWCENGASHRENFDNHKLLGVAEATG